MRSLSNLFRGSDQARGPMEFRPAGPDEVRPALRFILGGGDDAALDQFLDFARERKLPVGQPWLARRGSAGGTGGQILWAVLPVVNPGRTMLLFSPSCASDETQKVAAGLLARAVCGEYRRRDVGLVQVLLDAHNQNVREAYESAEFRLMAELDYLQVTLWRKVAAPDLPDGLRLVTYSPETHPVFARAILDSYEGSCDCPALNGLRDIEDVIAGHKAGGVFDPVRWWVLCDARAPDAGAEATPAGVLLLNTAPNSDTMELVYLGLSPAARGRGLGDLLMRQALCATQAAGQRRLALAVDANNPPALKLYHRHGLHRIGQKLALMRDLRKV